MVTETKEEIVDLELTSITPLQTRSCLRQDAVKELKFSIEQGTSIEPAVVVRDAQFSPPRCWLADGHHRLAAYRQLGRPNMPCRIQAGDKWDAIRIGLEANRKHVGERMSRADKEHAVRFVLKERPALADGAIAGLVGCDPKTVAKYRSEMVAGQEIPTCDVREGLDGKVYPIAPRPQISASALRIPTAKLDATPLSDTPFEPTPAGPGGSSSNGEIQKFDQIASPTSPAVSSANDENNVHQRNPRSDLRLPGHSVIASGATHDGDGSGRVVESRTIDDFEKNRSKAPKHLGRLWNCIDNMTAISPNPGMYQSFHTCADKISELLRTWPRNPAGIANSTGPEGSQAIDSDANNF